MEQCQFCGASMPADATFCGSCGHAPHRTSEHATYAGDLPTFDNPDGDHPTVLTAPNIDALTSAPTHLLVSPEEAEKKEDEEEKKRRAAALLGLGVLGALPGQQAIGQMPGLSGTPQISQMPGLSGTPQLQGGFASAPTSVPQPLSSPPGSPYGPPSSPGGSPGGYTGSTPGGGTPGGTPGGSPGGSPGSTPGGSIGGTSGCLTIAAIIISTILLILASIVGLGLTVWQPGLTLDGTSTVSPGATLTLQGHNFLPNSTITLVLDNNALQLRRHAAPAQLASLGQIQLTSLSSSVGKTIAADGGGSFELTISVDPSWSAGQHTIHASESPSNRSASLTFTIASPTATVTATATTTPAPGITPTSVPPALSCANPNPLELGPISEKSSQGVSGAITLCTTGSGSVNWTASFDQNQAAWLQLDQSSGSIQAPAQAQVTATASAANLVAGAYTTTVTFKSAESSATQMVTITLNVTAGCVNATPQRMSFSGVASVSDPAKPQTISVTNCGNTSNWSATATTQNGGNWLSLDYTNGTLNGGSTGQITVTASNLAAQLGAGNYSGTITITIGSQTTKVTVYLSVQAAPTLSAQTANTSNPAIIDSYQCTYAGGYDYCAVTLTNNSSSLPLTWSAKSNTKNVSVQARSQTIAAGGSEQVTVVIPSSDCGSYYSSNLTITFSGPANSSVIGWSCIIIT